jgi:hypothetical protein
MVCYEETPEAEEASTFCPWCARHTAKRSSPVKLIFQIAAGIVLDFGLIAAGFYCDDRYTYRLTVDKHEWEGARNFMNILVEMPSVRL